MIEMNSPWIHKGLTCIREAMSNKVEFAYDVLKRGSREYGHYSDVVIYPEIKTDNEWTDSLRKEQLLLFIAIQSGVRWLHPNVCDKMSTDPILSLIRDEWKDESSLTARTMAIIASMSSVNVPESMRELRPMGSHEIVDYGDIDVFLTTLINTTSARFNSDLVVEASFDASMIGTS